MPKMTSDKLELMKEIEMNFPFIEMPDADELVLHDENCFECRSLRDDLEEHRDKAITGETIRLIHQEMPHLSAKAISWILPHYLRFCLTSEAEYNRIETEFLIYHFGPSVEFQSKTSEQLSYLNKAQMECSIHFFEWCQIQLYWREYCLQDIERVIKFLRTIKK